MKKLSLAVVSAVFMMVGCGGGQTEACKKMIACADAAGATGTETFETTYGPSGTCWSNSQTAEACNTACESANAGYKTAFPDVAACQ